MKENIYKRELFPILESYPFEPTPEVPQGLMEQSNGINARMIERQSQIDSLMLEQVQDRLQLAILREDMRVQEKMKPNI